MKIRKLTSLGAILLLFIITNVALEAHGRARRHGGGHHGGRHGGVGGRGHHGQGGDHRGPRRQRPEQNESTPATTAPAPASHPAIGTQTAPPAGQGDKPPAADVR